MMELLKSIDLCVFTWINQTAIHPWLDIFFENVTDLHKKPIFVVCMLGLVLIFSIRKYRTKGWVPFLGLILAVGVSDLISYRVLKGNIERPRPFQSESLGGVRKLTDASGNSFPSNHAANCFAGAMILGIAFPRRRYLFYIFAAIVGYSRIYLGVHYPSDVLGGALIGLAVGYGAAFITILPPKPWSQPTA